MQLGSQHRVQCLGAAGPFAGAVRTLPRFSQPIFARGINGFDANSFLVFKVSASRGEVAQKRWLVISSAALGQGRGKLGMPENC